MPSPTTAKAHEFTAPQVGGYLQMLTETNWPINVEGLAQLRGVGGCTQQLSEGTWLADVDCTIEPRGLARGPQRLSEEAWTVGFVFPRRPNGARVGLASCTQPGCELFKPSHGTTSAEGSAMPRVAARSDISWLLERCSEGVV